MKAHKFRTFFFFIPLFMLTASGRAFGPSAAASLPDLDRRVEGLQTSNAVSGDQQTAVEQLRVRLPSVRVDFDPVTGGPKMISAGDKFLSGTNGQGRAISAAVAAGFAGDPHRATKAFLREHSRLFGYGPQVLNQARVKREFVTPGNGMKTVVWEQQVNGIPVFEAVLVSHTTARGELVNLSSQFVPEPENAADQGASNRVALVAAPDISARRATTIAAQNIGEVIDESGIVPVSVSAQVAVGTDAEKRQEFKSKVFKGNAEAKLVWLPMNPHRMRLCWEVILMGRTRGEMFRVLVDVQSGEPLLRHCLTDYLSGATYRVYTSDSPSPFSPGYSIPTTSQPPLVSRTLLTLSALDTNASPAGWINDGGNETLGNNVDAHTDLNADNLPDLPRPQGSPFRVFDFPLDLAQAPSTYTNAAVVQLFYWNNFMHDKLYELGFTEAAGNFQSNNFNRGGLGNDAVQADAQDGSGVNNANFSTPPDGSPGRMQMYLFTGPTPARDGDLDAEVMLHEYTHGLSNRRVGGGVGISALQPRGMGEGWSDFYAMALLSEAGDDVNAVYAYGGYATYQLSGLTQNYYFGIRRYPYCTDMTKNPLTFKDIDPAQASTHTGVPRSPVIGNTANEVHNMGEVWCMALREARANLINKYGWAVGNQLILQLVTDGMNLSPANPNFLQARDAILQADQVDNGGADLGELWTAFAKRGMGASATSPASSTTTGVQEAFDVPDNLHVSPAAGLTSSGLVGGPFSPACQTYWLSNSGTSNLTWIAWTTQPWVNVSVGSGILTPGSSNSVDVCLTAAANALVSSNYNASVIFSNTASGMSQTRGISLYVSPPRVLFFPLDTDPGWSRQGQWAFGKPAGLGGASHGHPDPTGGATGTNVFGVNLSGDYAITVGGPYYLTAGPFDFSGYSGMKLQFQRWLNTDYPPFVYATIEISTNGASWTGIWTNGPSEVADAAWTRVSYDISAYADGRTNISVRWGYNIGQSGAFAYSGWNLDDIEFIGNPTRNLSLSIPATATEGAGVLAGTVASSVAPTNDLVVTLNSSDTSEATVPVNVTIPAGQTNAVFNLTVVDDGVLDGSQTATITAAASGYGSANAAITVFDNETAVLSVVLPATATEGQGTVTGTVQVSAIPAANIVVSLSSSDTTEIQVPVSVMIPSGQTSAVFTATVVDDNQIDGPQNATVTAHVQNWTDGNAVITVLDNESLNLTVALPASALENTGVLANAGSVGISGTLTNNLVVLLASDTPGRLTVPATVTIPAGQVSSTFNLTLVDNAIHDGNQSVTVTASASGFTNGSSSILVVDDDVPPVMIAQPANQTAAIGGMAAFAAAAAGKSPLNYQWYFNSTPLTNNGHISGATTASLALTNVQTNDAGLYRVVVTNAFGSATSSNATLNVYPVPIITAFSPVSGSVGTTVNISGNGFDPATSNNIVYFGAVRAAVNTANATNLMVAVPAGATYAPITETVNGLTAYASAPFLVTFSGIGTIDTSSLTGRVDLAEVAGAGQVIIADLDGDGKPDLVVSSGASHTISLHRNISTNGTLSGGSFAARVDLSWSTGVDGYVAVADVDGDGKLDLVFVDASANQVVVLQNVSTPGSLTANSFAARVNFSVGSGPRGIAVQDLDGDGKPEIVTANYNDSTVSVLRNVGTAGSITTNSFAPAVTFATGTGPQNVAIADLDGDGKADLVTANNNGGTSQSLSLLRNLSTAGNILFASEVDLPGLAASYGLAIGDLDGDGKLDLVVSSFNVGQSVSVYRNVGTPGSLTAGSFAAHVDFAAGGWGNGVAIGDVDGDGKPDIALVTQIPDHFSLFKNVSTPGSFTTSSLAARVDYASGSNPNGVVIGDLDGDGRPDVVFANDYSSSMSIYRNAISFNGPPVFTSQPTNQTAFVGGAAGFNVVAGGSLPLSYQWKFGGTNIVGATNTTLTLTNVQLPQAGNYAVLVTNLFGSLLSSNAVLAVGAHHFVWSQISSPQLAGLPFAVTLLAKDANNGTITNFAGTVLLYGLATNQVGSNMDFEAGTLLPWTPLNAGNQPGPYDLVTYDVNGDGISSTAFRIAANAGTPDGITQSVPLTGGTTYSVKMDIATDDLTSGNNADGGTTTILIGGTTVAQFGWGFVNIGNIYRTNLTGTFTPPSNGVYAVTLTFYRGYGEPGNLWCLADDLRIASPGTSASIAPPVSGNFTNGIWNGSITVMNQSTGLVLVADDGQNHLGLSNPFNVLAAPAVDHFTLSPIPSPRFVNVPFAVSIQARNPANGLFTNFTGTAILDSTNGMAVVPPVSGSFIQGIWTGSVVIAQTASNLVLRANDGSGHLGLANPINVIGLPNLTMLRSGNIAIFLWPVGYSGFVLETSGRLSPATWAVVPYSPVQIGDQYLLPLDMTGTNGFYRLWFPGP